ncbi:MAG: hypothetical protein ABSD11_21045 [Methylocella sp.]|jgi:hypothetical protein
MRIAGIPPLLPPIADFLRKGPTLNAAEGRIHESAIWIIDVGGFVGREFPHS